MKRLVPRLVALALPLSLLGTACGDDETIQAASILVFEADPPGIMRGDTTELRWEVSGANRLTLFDDLGNDLVDLTDPPESGRITTPALQSDSRFTLEVEGQGSPSRSRLSVTVTVDAPDPEFLDVVAVPSQILAGQASALQWTTQNALAVDIETSTGAVVLQAGPPEGQTVVRPTGSVTYTLTARGIDVDATATLTVRVGNRPPSIERFAATPATITPGDQVSLTWQVVGSSQVSIRGVRTATVVYEGPRESGSEVIRLQTSEDFVLRAEGPGGVQSSTISVSVRPPEPVRIDRFVVEPNPSARGIPSEVAWSVRGATAIEIRQDGLPIQQTSQRSGRVPITVAGDRASFVLTATGAAGSASARTEAYIHDAPIIRNFSVDPPAVTNGGAVTVRWDVANVTQLSLSRGNGSPVADFPALTATTGPQTNSAGSLTFTATTTQVLTIEGASAAGAEMESLLSVVGRQEVEPNDNEQTALAPAPVGTTVDYLGQGLPGDRDVFLIEVPDGGSVSAETSSGPGLCFLDTVLRLQRNGVDIAVDDNGGFMGCSSITPDRYPSAGILPGGTYAVVVEKRLNSPYVLTLGPGDQLCGNGRREAPETCDDGGRSAGDGCSAACALETVGPILTPPGGQLDLGGTTAGGIRVARIALDTAGQSITATAADSNGGCNGVDTRIELLDETGQSLVAASSGGPSGTAGTCGAVDARSDRRARDLRTGLYYLRVTNEGGSAGPMSLRYTVINPACGNGLVESRAREQCDDGNTVAGDGCSSTCIFEGGAAPEQEPNDAQATATPSGLVGVGRVQLRGEIRPSGDDDVFSFEVPPLETLRLSARTYTQRDQLTSCDRTITDTRIFVERAGTEASRPGTGELAFNDDISTIGNIWCSALNNVLLTGGSNGTTYYIRIQGWQDRGLATWFLDLQLTR